MYIVPSVVGAFCLRHVKCDVANNNNNKNNNNNSKQGAKMNLPGRGATADSGVILTGRD